MKSLIPGNIYTYLTCSSYNSFLSSVTCSKISNNEINVFVSKFKFIIKNSKNEI